MHILDLSIGTIHKIFNASTPQAHKYPKEWKAALLFLAVCSLWHKIGVKRLYSNLFICNSPIDSHECYSNAALFVKNKYCAFVSRIIAREKSWDDFIKHVIELAVVTEINYRGHNTFMEGMPNAVPKRYTVMTIYAFTILIKPCMKPRLEPAR
ncbi:hypothetical protein BX667DRAFT_508704 [Coemansia mojavensis]|nr:hypothetical protein BX667DRAFT_508704 [Coemansia mojavensis]